MLEGEVLVEVDLTGLLVEVDLEEEIEATVEAEEVLVEEAGMTTKEVLVEEEETGVLKGMRCMTQYAISAATTAKFLSGQPKENLFTVKIVIKTKAGKPVQDLNLENQKAMKTLTRSTKNLIRS